MVQQKILRSTVNTFCISIMLCLSHEQFKDMIDSVAGSLSSMMCIDTCVAWYHFDVHIHYVVQDYDIWYLHKLHTEMFRMPKMFLKDYIFG